MTLTTVTIISEVWGWVSDWGGCMVAVAVAFVSCEFGLGVTIALGEGVDAASSVPLATSI